uniref:Uncharacterized protein n=1 Tax=Anguilla anguilla TaxID=7936 RepID=A0A0E9STQ3_ANGAN
MMTSSSDGKIKKTSSYYLKSGCILFVFQKYK